MEVLYDPEIFADINPMFRYVFNLLGGVALPMEWAPDHRDYMLSLMRKPKKEMLRTATVEEQRALALEFMFYLIQLKQCLESQHLVGTGSRNFHSGLRSMIDTCTDPHEIQHFISYFDLQNKYSDNVHRSKLDNYGR